MFDVARTYIQNQRMSGNKIKRYLPGIAVSCVMSFAVNGTASSQDGAPKPQGMPVSVIEAKPTSVPNTIEVTAQAEGAKETEVRARVSGILLKRLCANQKWSKHILIGFRS